MAQVTGDTMIGELLQIDENIAPILLKLYFFINPFNSLLDFI